MKSFRFLLLLVLSSALTFGAFIACGDDDEDPAPAPAPETCSEHLEAGSSGACMNEGDCTIVEAADVSTIAGGCMRCCLGMMDQATCDGAGLTVTSGDTGETCALDCINATAGTSAPCSTCYAAATQCGAANCLAECAGGDSPECDTCIDENCAADAISCRGF